MTIHIYKFGRLLSFYSYICIRNQLTVNKPLKPKEHETDIKRQKPTHHWLHRCRIYWPPVPARQQLPRHRILRAEP